MYYFLIMGNLKMINFFYDSFCRAVDSIPILSNNNAINLSQSLIGGSGSGSSSGIGGIGGIGGIPYLSSRVLQRYKELKQDGKYPLDIFQVYDQDRNGLILANKFKEVITQIQLLQTSHQLTKALDDFAAIGNRSYINYEDFCGSIENALNTNPNTNVSNNNLSSSIRRSSTGNQIVDSTYGYDGLRSSRNNNNSNNNNDDFRDLPSGRDDPNELYESLHRVRLTNPRNSLNHNSLMDSIGPNTSRSSYNNDNNHNNFYDYALSPPKPSDSISMFPPSTSMRRTQNHSIGSNSPPRRSSSPIQAPRTSPSKVGTKMWGHETPILQKGRTPRVDAEKWCCGVCLYVENPNTAMNCLVCDSPNYAARKDYQIKEQCRNCTFLNGQVAEECEMCGEPLSHAHHTSTNTNTNNGNSRKDISDPSPFPSGRKYSNLNNSMRY